MLCKQIIIITGPTATGKTGIGIKVAQKLGNAEIVSVDSRQIYRYMNIGTAKPNRDELESIRHHFIDVKDPDECYSAGRFGHEGRALIAELWEKKIIPVLVGGSGMYLQAIVDGLFVDGNDYSDTRQVLRQRLEEEGLEALFEELGRLDPQAQARLGANDAQRIMRALEVAYGGMEITGKRREQEESFFDGVPPMFCLTMKREKLYRRIEQRVDRMMVDGLVDEVKALVEKGYGRDCYAMGTLGYLEILDYLDGEVSLEESVGLIKSRSRKYAKRQWTWFRRDRRFRWLDLDVWGARGIERRILEHFAAPKRA